jgi:hypothetical protein
VSTELDSLAGRGAISTDTLDFRASGSDIILDVKGALTFTNGAEVLRDKVRSLLQQATSTCS